jgi:glyoxalase family protein
MRPLGGFHHVTAICGDPAANRDFYAGRLGMRLVKKTVNFDDPEAYHLYYGDPAGSPGTLVTFFAWPSAPPGRAGAGAIVEVGLQVPSGEADADPDGCPLATSRGPVSLRSVRMAVRDAGPTRRLLVDRLGFEPQADGSFRLEDARVDLVESAEVEKGRMGPGCVHHVAWRVADDEQQGLWRDNLLRAGLAVTPVRDRQYFRSIYFYEPGGVLFEIATDPPGFGIDEPADRLGSGLMLPPWLESARDRIAAALPPL